MSMLASSCVILISCFTFCSTGKKYIYTGSSDSSVYIYDLVGILIFRSYLFYLRITGVLVYVTM